MNELAEYIADPFRLMWEILPPEWAIPLMGLTALFMAVVMAKMMQWIDTPETAPPSAFDPESGYKYHPEDFE